MRHARMDPLVEHIDEHFHDFWPHARVPFGKSVCPQEHHRSDDLSRISVADPACMASKQVDLKVLEFLARDLHIDKLSDPGVDGIDRPAILYQFFKRFSRSQHPALGACCHIDSSHLSSYP